ncbi:MAG: acyltransferase family protein [Deltaproteobacteria bacterium]|nr:acyltransferase family protein [Deltaproteobacteria bacterium]
MIRLFQRGDEDRIDLQDPRSIDRWMPLVSAVRAYHRYEVHGLDNIPREGGALLALNHGPVPIDGPLLGATIYQDQGRLPRALTDHLVFKMPIMRELFLAVGAVDGRREMAGELLGKGNLVIVMPGGAPEAFKSSARAYELYWRQRTGFARVAIQNQVPVVPAACIGIDELYKVPFDMFELGKKLFGVRSMPFPLAWGIGPVPKPAKLDHFIGAPIPPPPPGSEDDADAVLEYRDRCVDAMEGLIAHGLALRDGRKRLADQGEDPSP